MHFAGSVHRETPSQQDLDEPEVDDFLQQLLEHRDQQPISQPSQGNTNILIAQLSSGNIASPCS